MVLSDKVNLQVKAVASSSNYIQYAFKFISYENKVINLSDYRIVCYFNTFREASIFIQERILAGYPSGSTSGSLSTTNGSINKEFFSVANPPRIYPTSERYDKEVILPMSGTAACLSANAYFDNMVWQIRFSSGQDFISENVGTSAYTIGLGAFAESYSYESSTSYVDNPTFVLEYNDPTYGWIKVLEYTNASTVDANTGLYPYDTIFEGKKAIGDINRQYGWDTTYDHDGIVASFDGRIVESDPTSAYPNDTTYTLNGSGTGSPNTILALYKFATDTLADKIVSAAELYTYFIGSTQTVGVEVRANVNNYTSASTWNSIGGWSGTSGSLQSQLMIDPPYQFQNSYIAHNLNKALVQDWKDTSANNFGLSFRYINPSGKAGYNSPSIASLENVDYTYLPTMFVYSGPISAAGSNYIRWKGTTSNAWSVGSNWEGGSVPLASDYAVFDESYYTNPCVLDSDHSIKNIITSGTSYSGTVDLSTSALTVYDTVSAFNISNFSNIITSSTTIELKGNIGINTTSGCFIENVILNTGATLQSPLLIIDSLLIKNSSTFGSTLATNILNIRTKIAFEIGNETISTFKLYLEMGASIPSTGTLSVASIHYFGSSYITSRTYNCPVYIVAPNNGTYSYASSSSAVFTSGDCTFNSTFSIIAEGSPNDSILTVDMNYENSNVMFNGGFYTSDCERQFLHIIFPSYFSFFYGDIKVGHVIISTSNTDNCRWRLVGNNTISMDQYDTRMITMPHIDKFDTGTLTLNDSYPPDYLSFESITLGSMYNTSVPSVNFNSHNLYSKNDMTIAAEGSTIQNIGGSILSAANMFFYKDASSNGSFVGASSWSAYSTGILQADGVSLANSVAASATGYAIRSSDLGGNINWYFDTIPPIILETSAVQGHYSQQPISAYYSITDAGGFDSNTIAVTNGFGDLLNVVPYSSTSATFMVVISGTQRCGQLEISAADFSGNIVEFTSLPFSYDATPPNISINNYSPPTGVSDSFIDVIVSANDNCILSGSQQVFAATFNNQPAQVQTINFSDHQNATVTIRLSSSAPVTNGDLYISATDAALNTSVFYSSAFTIATIAPQVTFESNPNFKIGSTVILVSAIFEDAVGMSNTIPYNMAYNGINIPFSTIYDSATKVILSAVIPSSRGAGSVSVTGYNTAGISATGIDSGYSFIPVIIFGDPVPTNISKTTITVPISAIGPFIDDSNYYYVRLSGTRMPISEPTSGLLNIFGYDFEYLSFSATVSSMSDLYGDLIISAGYR